MSERFFLDKIAIVTGASAGIGRATALALARQGAHVAISARREARLEQVASEIKEFGRDVLVVAADVTDSSQVKRLVEGVIGRWGVVDILVANAGEYVRSPVQELKLEVLRHSMAVNFYGGVYAILEVLPHMQQRKSGHIVVVTSMNGKKGMPRDAPYAAAKFAMTGFAEVLRQELYGSGVFVSNVQPGRVDTEMIRNLKVPWLSAKIPPEAVARAIVKAIEKRQPEVILPPLAIWLHYANVLSPRLGDAITRILHLEGWEK
jgi:NADP-dependent 3-hydroxy acid dehydrogenase YdfG